MARERPASTIVMLVTDSKHSVARKVAEISIAAFTYILVRTLARQQIMRGPEIGRNYGGSGFHFVGDWYAREGNCWRREEGERMSL
jgi:hypothetical protein